MRILVMNWRDLAHPSAGGAEVYVQQVLRRWAAAGHDVTFFTSAVAGRPAEESAEGYRLVRAGSKFTVYREARRWWQRHGRGRFDLVTEAVNTIPFFAHEWVDDGTPVLPLFFQTCEEIWGYSTRWPISMLGRRVLEPRWLARYRDVPSVAISDSTRDSLGRFGVRDVTVVPTGTEDLSTCAVEQKADQPTLVFCGRMVSYKRPDHVADAVARARRQVPDLRAWMIGDGPMIGDLRSSAPPGVKYLGRVTEDEKRALMGRAHLHVATSVREGWGMVVSEAAMLGTPTLAYNVPGLRDSTIAAGGQLVPASPQSLADALPAAVMTARTKPTARVPYGGAVAWDEVAAAWWSALLLRARVPRS